MTNIQYGTDFIFTSRSRNDGVSISSGPNEDLWVNNTTSLFETGKGTAGQVITSSTVPVQVVAAFQGSLTNNFDPANYTYLSNGRIQVNSAGVYLVTAYVTVPANSTGIRVVTITDDFVEVARETIVTTPGVFCRVNITLPLIFQEGVSVGIQYAQNSGGNLDITTAFLSLIKLGGVA